MHHIMCCIRLLLPLVNWRLCSLYAFYVSRFRFVFFGCFSNNFLALLVLLLLPVYSFNRSQWPLAVIFLFSIVGNSYATVLSCLRTVAWTTLVASHGLQSDGVLKNFLRNSWLTTAVRVWQSFPAMYSVGRCVRLHFFYKILQNSLFLPCIP